MSFRRNSLSAFLSFARTSLKKALNGEGKATIVIGNEAADLDSFTSSILYAYVKSLRPPRDAFSSVYIPVVNIPRRDLRLRPEFAVVCKHAHISPDALLTLDELHNIEEGSDLRFLLVDHNQLTGQLAAFAPSVLGVIDHHEEENAVRRDTHPEPRIIEVAGSCTSLVARYCRPVWDAIAEESSSSGAANGQGESAVNDAAFTRTWDANLAKVGLASILVDTANLTDVHKVTPVDVQMVEYLENIVFLSPSSAASYSRSAYYKELKDAKNDVSQFTLPELLRRDYKAWTETGGRLGISSMTTSLQSLVKRKSNHPHSANILIDDFIKERKLDLFAIMTMTKSTKGEKQREIYLQSSNKKSIQDFLDQTKDVLDLEPRPDLDLKGNDKDADENIKFVATQHNYSQSRKQVAPMLRKVLQGQD